MPKQIDGYYQRILKKAQSEKERQAKKQEILDQGKI
jgi:hypothetical protein